MAMSPEEIEIVKARNKICGQRIQRYITAEPEDKQRYWLSYWQAQRELVRINRPLIENAARRMARKLPSRNKEDFEANVDEVRYVVEDAAMRAAEDVDPLLGEYSTRFYYWLKSFSIKHDLSRKRGLGTTPPILIQRYKEISSIEQKLTQELRRKPTPEEICNHLKSIGRNERAHRKVHKYHLEWRETIEKQVYNSGQSRNEDNRLSDVVVDQNKFPFQIAAENEEKELLLEYVNNGHINEREKIIIRGRFGFPPYTESLTLKQIGDKLRLTRQRVKQIQDDALKKLRKAMEENGHTLESFF